MEQQFDDNQPTLISFKLCPYVFRAVATMLQKKQQFKIVYIDLANKPDWFKKISPLSKVPILKVKDKVLFESSVIAEYIDEISPPSLHPTDPLLKSENKALFIFAGEIIGAINRLIKAKEVEAHNAAYHDIQHLLSRLESRLKDGNKYFNSNDVNMIDLILSSIFVLLSLIQPYLFHNIYESFPKLNNYSKNILELESVKNAKVPEFDELFNLRSQANQAYYLSIKKIPNLYGFVLCPYAMRIRTLLETKGITYNITWIDLRNKPDWFIKISPLGKTPVLQVGEKYLFESNVIMEYLDDITPIPMMPPNPIEKAEARAWISVAGALAGAFHGLYTEKDESKLAGIIQNGAKILQRIEDKLTDAPFFLGNTFTQVDVAFAPMFNQLGLYQQLLKQDFYEKFPKVRQYVINLFHYPSFLRSVPLNFVEIALQDMKTYYDPAILKIYEQQQQQQQPV